MSKTKVETVHFTVEAEFINTHARRLWSEGEYRKAIDFLGTMRGITLDQINLIIIGKQKFEEIGETQTFRLVPDDWSPNLNMCHLGQYPDPANPSEMSAAEDKLAELRAEKQVNATITRMMNEAGDDRMAQLRVRDYLNSRQMGLTELEAADLIEKYQAAEEFNAKLEEGGKPEPSAVYENGIITPDGKFYRCEFSGHGLLAEKLGYKSRPPLAPDEVAVQDGCAVVSANLIARKLRVIGEKQTPEMHDTIREWFALTFDKNIPLYNLDS